MTVDGKFTAKCKVYVVSRAKAVKTLKVPGSGTTGLLVGQTMQVKPTWTSKATGVVPTFSSDNPYVAVIDKAGVLTAVSPGKAVITVKAGAKKKKFVFTVGTVAPTGLTLDMSGLVVVMKRGNQMPVFVTSWAPTNADPKTVVWKTSNKKIATVSANGVVKAKKKGKVTISAVTWNGKTSKFTVIVE